MIISALSDLPFERVQTGTCPPGPFVGWDSFWQFFFVHGYMLINSFILAFISKNLRLIKRFWKKCRLSEAWALRSKNLALVATCFTVCNFTVLKRYINSNYVILICISAYWIQQPIFLFLIFWARNSITLLTGNWLVDLVGKRENADERMSWKILTWHT